MQEVSQIGSTVIRAVAAEVPLPITDTTKSTIELLTSTMRERHLVGMAAPQIGRPERIFVTELRETKFRKGVSDPLRVFINPTITNFSTETELGYEGCGSVAESNIFGEVERSRTIDITWSDESGAPHTETIDGFLARVVQHEYDHLNGIVFIDRVKNTKTLLSGSEFQKRKIS